jgi:hypothetical protein
LHALFFSPHCELSHCSEPSSELRLPCSALPPLCLFLSPTLLITARFVRLHWLLHGLTFCLWLLLVSCPVSCPDVTHTPQGSLSDNPFDRAQQSFLTVVLSQEQMLPPYKLWSVTVFRVIGVFQATLRQLEVHSPALRIIYGHDLRWKNKRGAQGLTCAA